MTAATLTKALAHWRRTRTIDHLGPDNYRAALESAGDRVASFFPEPCDARLAGVDCVLPKGHDGGCARPVPGAETSLDAKLRKHVGEAHAIIDHIEHFAPLTCCVWTMIDAGIIEHASVWHHAAPGEEPAWHRVVGQMVVSALADRGIDNPTGPGAGLRDWVRSEIDQAYIGRERAVDEKLDELHVYVREQIDELRTELHGLADKQRTELVVRIDRTDELTRKWVLNAIGESQHVLGDGPLPALKSWVRGQIAAHAAGQHSSTHDWVRREIIAHVTGDLHGETKSHPVELAGLFAATQPPDDVERSPGHAIREHLARVHQYIGKDPNGFAPKQCCVWVIARAAAGEEIGEVG